jgi:peptidoglycan/xylan/chitin deacetylase (PgdA/CDA1 family)
MKLKDLFFKYGYYLRLHRLFKMEQKRGTVTVACLHRINNGWDPLFPALKPGTFGKLVRLLKKEYEITNFTEINDRSISSKWKKPALVISFDDGYRDFLEYCMPVIRKEKITVNHNVVVNCAETGQIIWTQRINNLLNHLAKTRQSLNIQFEDINLHQETGDNVFTLRRNLSQLLFTRPYPFIKKLIDALEAQYSFEQPANQMMNWDDIISCSRDGIEIGSHTITHAGLAEDQGEEYFKHEIADSRKIMEQKLGVAVESFAFPNGLAHPAAYDMAVKTGYKNILLIDVVKYSFDLKAGPATPYKRTLIGYPNHYEDMFNIARFHKMMQR